MDEIHYLEFLTDEVKEKLEELIAKDLQFVDIPRDILCSSCGCIPVFHYIYPCLHPYCWDCFKNKFLKHNMKCKVCKRELGPRLLQRTSIEHEIYMLKAFCPNQCNGCKDVMQLHSLLEHLKVCQFTEKNQGPKVQLTVNNEGTNQKSDEEIGDLNSLKITISKMVKKIADLTKLEEILLENQKRCVDDITQLSLENKKIINECKKLQDDNVAMNKKIISIKEKVKLIKIKSQQQTSNIEIDPESLKLSAAISTTDKQIDSEPNVSAHEITASEINIPPQAIAPEVMEKRLRKLENVISDVSLSQMAIRNNVEQYIRVIVAAQLIPEDEPVIRETIFENIEGISYVTKESDLGKLIINNQQDFKKEILLMKTVIENNNAVIKHQSEIFKSICNTNKENEKECKKQDMIIETLERKFDKMLEQIYREIKESEAKDKTDTVNLIKEELLKVARNPWNNLNFNDQDEIKIKTEKIKSLKNGTLLLQIENYKKKRKDKSTLFGEPFYTSKNGFKMRIKIEFKSNIHFGHPCIGPSIELLPGELNQVLPTLIYFRATVSILDQSGRSEKRDRVMVYEPAFGKVAETVLENDSFYWQNLSETEEKDIYVRRDKIFVKVEIEPLTSLFHNYFSNNGILVWNVDDYERTKRESVKQINYYNYSNYFYSSESGFRMKARIWFNDKFICFDLLFLVGEFDSELPSFFNHKCTVSLISQNQSTLSENHVIGSRTLDLAVVGEKKVREIMSGYCGHGIGSPQSKVEKEPYLVDDKLVVKFVVEAL